MCRYRSGGRGCSCRYGGDDVGIGMGVEGEVIGLG